MFVLLVLEIPWVLVSLARTAIVTTFILVWTLILVWIRKIIERRVAGLHQSNARSMEHVRLSMVWNAPIQRRTNF